MLMTCFGNKRYTSRIIEESKRTSLIDFKNILVLFFPFSKFSDARGNMVFPIADVPNKIIFPSIDSTAYLPAISAEKNAFARIISRLYISTIEIIAVVTGTLYLYILSNF